MRTIFLISQVFYVILCDVGHFLDLTFPIDSGIIDLMKNIWCDVDHTVLPGMSDCLFDLDITKRPKEIMKFFDITEGAKKIMKFWDYEGHKINHELLGELK